MQCLEAEAEANQAGNKELRVINTETMYLE